MADYRIEFSLQRREEGEDDFTEIGFGSSGSWASPEMCAEMVAAGVVHGEWETQDGMPDPDEVCREVRDA